MSSQSVPATSASPDTANAAAEAIQAVSLQDAAPPAASTSIDATAHGNSDDDEAEDGEDVNAIDLDESASSTAPAASTSAKKKKKKAKGKGKAKALDKLKTVLGGSSSSASVSHNDDGEGASLASNKASGAISDELYDRIVAEARKNAGAEAAAKLDRRTVVEMIESACSYSIHPLATLTVMLAVLLVSRPLPLFSLQVARGS